MPGAAAETSSVPSSPAVTLLSAASTKLPPPGGSLTGSAEISAGIPLGEKPSKVTEPRASPTATPTGVSMLALGSCSTMTSSARPQVLPVSASRLERPTDQDGYWLTMPSVSEVTSKTTSSQARTASGEPVNRDHQRSDLCPSPSASVKWKYAATRSATTVRPRSTVVKPNRHSGNWFDHGTPKLETYHQPLTLANDRAVMNSTAEVKTARLRRDRST